MPNQIPNFDNELSCIEVLQQDKHTRLEGLCIEAFFIENYLTGIPKHKLSFNWWFSKKDCEFYAIKFYADLQFSDADQYVASFLLNQEVRVYVIFYENGKYLYSCLKMNENLNLSEILESSKKYALDTLNPLSIEIKDRNRQQQAIQFLQDRNAVRKNAIERFFANRVGKFKGLWDVDAFVVENNFFIKAYEVKQKFPAKNGCFGINKGSAEFLLFLGKLGFEVEHIILKKPSSDVNIPALDFITNFNYKGKNEWLKMAFTEESFQLKVKKSPNYTSIHGKMELSYYDVNMALFESVGFI